MDLILSCQLARKGVNMKCPECFEVLTYSQAMEVIGAEVNSRK